MSYTTLNHCSIIKYKSTKSYTTMKIYILILRNKSIFKIFAILMLVGVIFDSNIHNSANHTFGDYDYRRVVNQNNSLASLISKNSQIYENRSVKIEKDYEKEFDWPLYGNISILMSQLETMSISI